MQIQVCAFVDMDAADVCNLIIIVSNGTKVVDVDGDATQGVTTFGGQLMA